MPEARDHVSPAHTVKRISSHVLPQSCCALMPMQAPERTHFSPQTLACRKRIDDVHLKQRHFVERRCHLHTLQRRARPHHRAQAEHKRRRGRAASGRGLENEKSLAGHRGGRRAPVTCRGPGAGAAGEGRWRARAWTLAQGCMPGVVRGMQERPRAVHADTGTVSSCRCQQPAHLTVSRAVRPGSTLTPAPSMLKSLVVPPPPLSPPVAAPLQASRRAE